MDIMEKIDVDNQMTILQDAVMEEGAQPIEDEVEDLSNSLREIVQDEAVKPKLHCLMMDPAFSMVTVQSEDSGIVWETASSRCSTPWASEFSSAPPEPCYSLVPKRSGTPSSETAGKIIFIMDEDHMIRRKKRKRNKAEEKVTNRPALMAEVLPGPERPAMVEVSLPNTRAEEESAIDEKKDPKDEGNQRLFCLLSEGSEILNIIAPPKIFTVDEEESKELTDNLSYLEETPVIKAQDIAEEPETEETQTENLQAIVQAVPEPLVPTPIKPPRRGATSEDYFEKFTLLDHQAPAVAPPLEAIHDPEIITEQVADETKDKAVETKPEVEVSADSVSLSGLEIASEHVDEVFYGGGSDPDRQSLPKDGTNTEGEAPKSPLKESGSALFGSQESILTPIFLPEGPPKIIDPNLLEEPKAMAFMYSDLYADAVGTRQKQDDTESLTSEKSFHSQQSDFEDRGYLEKFVLKDETPATEADPFPEDHKADRVKMWSEDAFGVPRLGNDKTGAQDDEEITDFFRNSASSSPCETIRLDEVEPEETREETKTRRVVFQDEAAKAGNRTSEVGDAVFVPSEEDIELAEAFLPLDISMESPSVETSWVTVDNRSAIAEYAVKTVSPKSGKAKRVKPPKEPLSIRPPQRVNPVTPHPKPFLDLTPLLPAEAEEEAEGRQEQEKELGTNKVPSTFEAKGTEATGEALDYELITKQEASECAVSQRDSPRGGEGSDNGGFTMVEYPSQLDNLYDAVEADYEIVDAPAS
ncbi:cardiomyopathy-associated protein 5 [Colossoma macropomum]|uniref:cardiomyopathy-associated protein 5 n=1 Tax=Colossoma macropomum TaxID=42526 RepID=UPI001864B940|nr:cardiomyopathy-associated protein 5 [Colossoma macropomum]